MTVKMALVEKAAGQRDRADFHALLQQGTGLLDAAVHPVGVGRDAGNLLELAQQRVRVGTQLPCQVGQGQILLQVAGQAALEVCDRWGRCGRRFDGPTTAPEQVDRQIGQGLLFGHQVGISHQAGHGVHEPPMKILILHQAGRHRDKIFRLPEGLLNLKAPVRGQVKHAVAPGPCVCGVAAMEGFRIDEGQRAGAKADLPIGHPENNVPGINGADAETPVHMWFEQSSTVLGIAAFDKRQAFVFEKGFPIHGNIMLCMANHLWV